MFICSFSYSQNDNSDTKLEILKKIFSVYDITTYGNETVFETKVWEKHATISFNDCNVLYFDNGKLAIAFYIYLSNDPNQYKFMTEENINLMGEISENTLFQGGGQRLIQVIFFDTKTGKFLGKD